MNLSVLTRCYIFVAALLAASAIALGAYASHGMVNWASPKQVSYVELASQYQLFHALAIILISIVSEFLPSKRLRVSQFCFILGCVCFSGSLYYLAFSGSKLLVMITPLGGLALILAWLIAATAMFKKGK